MLSGENRRRSVQAEEGVELGSTDDTTNPIQDVSDVGESRLAVPTKEMAPSEIKAYEMAEQQSRASFVVSEIGHNNPTGGLSHEEAKELAQKMITECVCCSLDVIIKH